MLLGVGRQSVVFQFNWDKIDIRLGLWFALVAFVVMNLGQFRDAAWMTAGISALLAWLPLLLTGHSNFRSGALALLAYLFVGIVLSVGAHLVLLSETGRIAAVGGVTFAAALVFRFGVFWYLVGYVLVFWYVLSPLFSGTLGLADTIEGHVVGVMGILLYWTAVHISKNGWTLGPATPATEKQSMEFVIPYAGILSVTMMTGLGVGGRILSADPTLMAQASLNIISPSVKQTWQAGIVRTIFGIGGILIGFYIGLLFPSLLVFEIVISLCSFVALAFLKVHMAFLVGAFAVLFSYPIGAQGPEIGHGLGNERLLAEFLGIPLAIIAISLMSFVSKKNDNA